MAEEKLLTVREVAVTLGISERDVVNLAENATIPAYKIGGVYLRFKKDQVLAYRKTMSAHKNTPALIYPLTDRIGDFLYFNDFYIGAAILIVILLIVILKGY